MMITEQDILEGIAECQGQRNPNSSTCMKLASFYTILDHMRGNMEEKPVVTNAYSFDANIEPVVYDSDSDFGRAIKGKDEAFVYGVIEELMETLHEMIPRLYDGVIRRLNE